MKQDDHGIYEAGWVYGNADLKKSAFFPKEWTPRMAIDKVLESLQNGQSLAQVPGRFVINGITNEGIKIKTIVEIMESGNGKLISSYANMG